MSKGLAVFLEVMCAIAAVCVGVFMGVPLYHAAPILGSIVIFGAAATAFSALCLAVLILAD